jgi:hypothetical protein
MIKSLNVSLAIFAVSLLLAGCFGTIKERPSADQGGDKPSRDVALGEQITLKFDEQGRIVPFTKDGLPYEPCGKGTKRECALYKEKITITELETISILKVKSKASPICETIEIVHGGKKYIFVNPACPK